jgi:two-component system, cell cycle response regulator
MQTANYPNSARDRRQQAIAPREVNCCNAPSRACHAFAVRSLHRLGDWGTVGTLNAHEKPLDKNDAPTSDPESEQTVEQLTAERDQLQHELASLRQENAHLWTLALEDPLTGLANRRALAEAWAHEASRSQRYGYACSVIAADLDRFKEVNDQYGHDAGDRVLIAIARLFTANVRTHDIVARVGGEEFTIILGRADLPDALAVAERILTAVATADLVPAPGTCTLSVGLACSRLTPHGDMLQAADRALYEAKVQGRNRVVVWPGPLTT